MRLSRNMRGVPLLRGLALLALGVLLLVEPLRSLQNLVYLFSAFLLLDGILAAAQGLLNRDQIGWRWWLVQGAVDAAFAVTIIVWPGITALVLFYLLLVWALVLGVASVIGGAALLRNRDLGWPWLLTIGLISTLFGLMLTTKAQTASADILDLVVVVFGLYAFVLGAVHIVSVFSMRWVAQEIDRALAGESLVVTGVAERREAARQAAAAKAAERKAAKASAKEDEAPAGEPTAALPAAALPTTVATVTAPPEELHDRVVVDEMAAYTFPDTPGVVVPPVPPIVVEQDDSTDTVTTTDVDPDAGPGPAAGRG